MPTFPMTRRAFTSASLAAAALPLLGHSAVALDRDAISIAYPNDVPTWDPHLRLAQNAQSLYKMVFDSPLTQAPDLSVVPNLVRAWHYRDPLTLELELRDDALFHTGDKVTARDLRTRSSSAPALRSPAAVPGSIPPSSGAGSTTSRSSRHSAR
jgi:peptide/nickel transport system substrate-binding protein